MIPLFFLRLSDGNFLESYWRVISSGVNTIFLPSFPRHHNYMARHTTAYMPLRKSGGIGEYKLNRNPGPWTFKQQMLATIMVNFSIGGAYFTQYNVFAQKLPRCYIDTYITLGYELRVCFSS
ncbi:hypothetical protein V1511DRAFT_323917 [Dipodascopsis uninucleata]